MLCSLVVVHIVVQIVVSIVVVDVVCGLVVVHIVVHIVVNIVVVDVVCSVAAVVSVIIVVVIVLVLSCCDCLHFGSMCYHCVAASKFDMTANEKWCLLLCPCYCYGAGVTSVSATVIFTVIFPAVVIATL